MSNILKIKNISKSYLNRQIVKDVSLEVSSSEVIGLFGPNGAGKTTCFSIIAGLIKPDSGSLLLNDHDITKMPINVRARLGISYLPQESSIFRELSVLDNIRAVLEVVESNKSNIEIKAQSLLDEFSISHLKNTQAINLSGGERRRLEIARTIAVNPKFIMLDEPLVGIDPITIIDIKKLIIHLKNHKIGVFITDHNIRETLEVVDRGYVMYDGHIITSGTPQDILQCDDTRRVYLGEEFIL